MKKLYWLSLLISLLSCNSGETQSDAAKANSESKINILEKEREKELDLAAKELQFVCACIKYEYVNEMTDEEIIRKAIEGMMSTLDLHSTYLNEKAFNSLKNLTEGEFGGLGIEFMLDDDGYIRIISAIDDTPAYKAGIKSGDIIIGVDGEYLGNNITDGEVIEKLRGKPGTTVKLKVIRGRQSAFDVTIKRDLIKVKSVKAEVLDDIGYIRISTFDKNTSNDVKKFIKANSSLKGIIIDIRNNPGGLLDEAVSVSDLFLKKCKIVSTKGRTKDNTMEFFANDEDITNGLPIAVLINSGTASAPEILAGALRDNKRAVIIGTRSFGKGSVQKVIALSENTGIKLTIAKYYTPNGECIQGNGISPDIEAGYASIKKFDGLFSLREELFNNALDSKETAKKHPNAKKLPDSIKEKDLKRKEVEEDEELAFRKMSLKERAEKDYQLNKAFDMLKAINIYNKINSDKLLTQGEKSKTEAKKEEKSNQVKKETKKKKAAK